MSEALKRRNRIAPGAPASRGYFSASRRKAVITHHHSSRSKKLKLTGTRNIYENKTWKDCAVAKRDSRAVESSFGKWLARSQASELVERVAPGGRAHHPVRHSLGDDGSVRAASDLRPLPSKWLTVYQSISKWIKGGAPLRSGEGDGNRGRRHNWFNNSPVRTCQASLHEKVLHIAPLRLL